MSEIRIGVVVPVAPTTTGSDHDHEHDHLGRFGGCSECQSRLVRMPDAPPSPPRAVLARDASVRPCAFCGDGGQPEGLSWTFAIKRQLVGLNAHRTNAGATRFAYADERREWGWELEVAKRRYGIPAATGPRRVVITRYIAAPNSLQKQRGRRAAQLLDYGNLVGGCKPLVDAMVKAKLLTDDSPAALRDHYRQVISDFADDFDKVEITITDIIEAPP